MKSSYLLRKTPAIAPLVSNLIFGPLVISAAVFVYVQFLGGPSTGFADRAFVVIFIFEFLLVGVYLLFVAIVECFRWRSVEVYDSYLLIMDRNNTTSLMYDDIAFIATNNFYMYGGYNTLYYALVSKDGQKYWLPFYPEEIFEIMERMHGRKFDVRGVWPIGSVLFAAVFTLGIFSGALIGLGMVFRP